MFDRANLNEVPVSASHRSGNDDVRFSYFNLRHIRTETVFIRHDRLHKAAANLPPFRLSISLHPACPNRRVQCVCRCRKVFVVLQPSVGFALLCDGAVVVVFAFRAVPHIECGVFFGIEIVQPAVVFRQRNRRYVGFVAVPVQADAQTAAVEQYRQDGGGVFVLGVFEIGEEMGANLPAVTPAFDMRRGERFAQICGDLLYQLLPYLPVFLVVGFDLRNAFGLVFF